MPADDFRDFFRRFRRSFRKDDPDRLDGNLTRLVVNVGDFEFIGFGERKLISVRTDSRFSECRLLFSRRRDADLQHSQAADADQKYKSEPNGPHHHATPTN
jgi:hypothetical protein